MNSSVATIPKLLLFAGVVAALCEADWRISLVLAGAGFSGLIICGLVQGTADNNRYRAAVTAQWTDQPGHSVATLSPYSGLAFLSGFAGVSFLAIYLDSVWPVGTAFVGAVLVGLEWSRRKSNVRYSVWTEFARNHGLAYCTGVKWDYRENPTVSGDWNGRSMRFGTAWQYRHSSGAGSSSAEVFIAEISAGEPGQIFCIDRLKTSGEDSPAVSRLFAFGDLMERIEAAAPRRISLDEQRLAFHFPRVPATHSELTFYLNLLSDCAVALE